MAKINKSMVGKPSVHMSTGMIRGGARKTADVSNQDVSSSDKGTMAKLMKRQSVPGGNAHFARTTGSN